MKNDFKKKLELLEKKLYSSKAVTILNFELKPPVWKDELEVCLSLPGIHICNELIAFYETFNGVDILYKYSTGIGFVEINPLAYAIGGPEFLLNTDHLKAFENILWNEGMEENEINTRMPLKEIEGFNGSDYSVVFNAFVKAEDLYCVNKYQYNKLPISFSEYINLSVACAGLDKLKYKIVTPSDANISVLSLEEEFNEIINS